MPTTLTLRAPKNYPAIRELIDASNLTASESLWLARVIVGATMVAFDPDDRVAILRAFVQGVLHDVSVHESRRADDGKL